MRSPHRRRVRGWLGAIPAALALLGLLAGPTTAAENDKYGTVAVIDASTDSETIVNGEPQVCDFYFRFDLNETSNVVGWVVKTWASTPLSGTTVLQGKGGPTDADGKLRQPDSGSLSLPDGRYNVIWDDESPVDGSNGHQSFVVSCAAAATPTPTAAATPTPTPTAAGATPTPTPTAAGATPTPTPTEAGATPTPTPSGTAFGAGGHATPTPAGGVKAALGTPATTLPPTDTALVEPQSGGSSPAGAVGLGLALLGIVMVVLVWPARGRATARVPRNKR